MHTNIPEVINSRLKSMGMSQAQFAKLINTSPTQIGHFFRGQGSLTTSTLNQSLDLVGIDISMYKKRNDLAKEVATFLISKNVTSIDNWSKEDLARFTNKNEIKLLFDVESKEEFLKIQQSGIIDIESTFLYFKALIAYMISIEGKEPTSSKAKRALDDLLYNHKSRNLDDKKEMLINTIGKTADVASEVMNNLPPITRYILNGTVEVGKQIGAYSLFSKFVKSSLFSKSLEFLLK